MSKLTRVFALLLAIVMLAAVFVACGEEATTTTNGGNTNTSTPAGTTGGDGPNPPPTVAITEFDPNKQYIYRDAMSSIPANWNPHTYQTTDESVPLDYTTDSFYTLFYNDKMHPVDGVAAYEGYVIVPAMAAGYPVDVTAEIKAAHPEFKIPDSATSGYAWKITLRSDLKWDDGTPITAKDFVDSLERVLRPELLNYRAADYYEGSYVVVNADEYSLSGISNTMDAGVNGITVDKMTKNKDGQYIYTSEYGDCPVYIAVGYCVDWTDNGEGWSLKDLVELFGEQYFGLETWDELVGMMDEDGLVPCTDATMALLAGVTTTNEAWDETEADLFNYMVYIETRPDGYPMSNVGLQASEDGTELTFIFKNALEGFYLMTYGMNVPLVKTSLYDSLLTSTETAEGTVWSNTYNSNLSTAASYGPYKLSSYQTDKSMHFVKNTNWYGWTDDNFTYIDPTDGNRYRMYQTTEIDIQYVEEATTRRMMFLQGKLMGYGLQAADYEEYRSSDYCYATPGQTVFGMVLNGYLSQLQKRENASDFDKATTDLETMTLTSFRKALAVSIDRDRFAAEVSPSRSAGYGLLGEIYVYDPETGALYRNTDQAKKALCDFYSIDVSKYNGDLDAAVDAITGYDPETAKELFKQAFDEALAAGYVTDTDGDGICDQTVTMMYALSADNDFYTQTLNYLNASIGDVAKGTPFEGKIQFIKSAPLGDPGWSNAIRGGTADCVLAGWQGATMDPFGFADTWTNDRSYWNAWFDATKEDLTITVEGKALKMKLRDWAECLNGAMKTVDGVDYNFGYGQADVNTRLDILAAIEVRILGTYNTLPMLADGSMSLLSQQVYYVVEDYSPMMSRGGIAYMKYNYDETAWNNYVQEQGGQLKY